MYNNILDYISVSDIIRELKNKEVTLNEFSKDNLRVFQKAVKRLILDLSERFDCNIESFKTEHMVVSFSTEKKINILKVSYPGKFDGIIEYYVINPVYGFFEFYSLDVAGNKFISEAINDGVTFEKDEFEGTKDLLIGDILKGNEELPNHSAGPENEEVINPIQNYTDKSTEILKKRLIIEYTKDTAAGTFTIDRIIYENNSIVDLYMKMSAIQGDSLNKLPDQMSTLKAMTDFYSNITNLVKVVDRKKYLDIWYLKTENLQPEEAREKYASTYADANTYFLYKVDETPGGIMGDGNPYNTKNIFVLYEDFDIDSGKSIGVLGTLNPDDNRLLLVAGETVEDDNELYYTTYVTEEYYLESVIQTVNKVVDTAVGVPAKIISTAKGFIGKGKTLVRKINDANTEDEREDILNNEYFPLVSTVLHYICIPAVLIVLTRLRMINPLIGLIIGILQIFYKNVQDKRRKMEAIAHLRTEVEILDEKISDARGANDNTTKYQLMRVKRLLEARISKVGGTTNI